MPRADGYGNVDSPAIHQKFKAVGSSQNQSVKPLAQSNSRSAPKIIQTDATFAPRIAACGLTNGSHPERAKIERCDVEIDIIEHPILDRQIGVYVRVALDLEKRRRD